MPESPDRRKRTSGRLPLILLGGFAVVCLVALVFLGDLARYQESAMVGESQAALRDVTDAAGFDRALKQYPGNRILKLVALADGKWIEIDAALRKALDEAAPAALARPANLAASSRADLEGLRRDLKAAESNVTALASRVDAMIKARREDLQAGARALGLDGTTVARFMTAVDEQFAEWKTVISKTLAARAEYHGAYERCAALLARESGSYKVTNGQFIFRLQPTADSYNAAAAAMADAAKRMAEFETEREALRRSQFVRWKKFVGD